MTYWDLNYLLTINVASPQKRKALRKAGVRGESFAAWILYAYTPAGAGLHDASGGSNAIARTLESPRGGPIWPANALAKLSPYKLKALLEKDLMALDGTIKGIVSIDRARPLVVSHPVYEYFAKRYGLNIQSVHWEPDDTLTNTQIMELKSILKEHSAKWMIWEGATMKQSVESLKEIGVDSLVFNPCGNTPDQGDFLSVMRQNVNNLKSAYVTK